MRTTHAILAFAVAVIVLWPRQTNHIHGQDDTAIHDPEVCAVYASVLPAIFVSGDRDLTRVAILQETRSKMSCFTQSWAQMLEFLESCEIPNKARYFRSSDTGTNSEPMESRSISSWAFPLALEQFGR
jgi:hypothetical protein